MPASFRNHIENSIHDHLRKSTRFQRGLLVGGFIIGVGIIGLLRSEAPEHAGLLSAAGVLGGVGVATGHRRRTMNACNGLVDVYSRDQVGHIHEGRLGDDFSNTVIAVCTPMAAIMSGSMTEMIVDRVAETGGVDALSTAVTTVLLGATGVGYHLASYVERDGAAAFARQLDAIDGHH